jgi:putative ubiquitin-RnfH superfamily antitoxin RatB of RatAB toxin-antitoxin module
LPEDARKHCVLALDIAQGPIILPLILAAGATIAAALAQARCQLKELGMDAGIDWESSATGVWGVRCERSVVPREGDRIELYRSLTADPRHRRRQRARGARRA